MKNQIKAEVIADSINEQGERILSFVGTLPRIVLAELNTHRMLSRNSASSRAIPYKKMLKKVLEDPFIPIAWQKDHKGMQGNEYFDGWKVKILTLLWLFASKLAVGSSWLLSKIGLTKQICNRILEPFMWHTVIITVTELENFFHLRCPQYQMQDGEGNLVDLHFRSREDWLSHWDDQEAIREDSKSYTEVDWLTMNKSGAEIHIARFAECMWDALNESTPKQLKAGEWHIPFGDNIDLEKLRKLTTELELKKQGKDGITETYTTYPYLGQLEQNKIKIATARCARVSYMNYEGKDDYQKDIELYESLSSAGHWSPFEHCAQAMGNQHSAPFLVKAPKMTDRGKEEFQKQWLKLMEEQPKGYIVSKDSDIEFIPLGGQSGNFKGWIQLRKTFATENVTVKK